MDAHALMSVMINAAHLAAETVQSRKYLKVSSKGEVGNIVTVADKKSEKLIKNTLSRTFPDCVFIAEEGKTTITRENFAEYKLVFVIDPIDGTTNYKYGIPASAISIGAWSDGKPVASVVYNLGNDDLYTATFLGDVQKNGKAVTKRTVFHLKDAIIGSDWGYADSPHEIIPIWNRLVGNVMSLRVLGSAVLGLVYVLTGQYTCYVNNVIKPYDVGAAMLMLQKLGIMVTNWSGEPFSIFDEKIIAAPPQIHHKLSSLLFDR